MDSKLQFSANYIFQRLKTKKKKTRRTILNQDEVVLVPEPTFDSETGESLKEENLEIQTESSKNSIYLMQNLGWGNSVQKANRLYNKHLFEEIKSHLINISDNYDLMKTWLVNNYGGPSRIVGDIVSNLEKVNR